MEQEIRDDDLPKIYECCYTVLEQYPESRDCNMALFFYFYKHFFNLTDTEIIKNKAVYLPKFNSIEREARKVQEDGYFLPSRFVENCRSMKEETMRMYHGKISSGAESVRANYKDRSFKNDDIVSVSVKKKRKIIFKNKWLKKIAKEAEIEFRRILNGQTSDEISQREYSR